MADQEDEDPDWEAIFWRIQRFWPHDDRFAPEQFGFQPTWLIVQALHYGAKMQHEELHLGELGIATLTSCFINANRDPKSTAAKPSDFYYFQPRSDEERVAISAIACDTFFSLVKDGKMPGWVVPLVPVDRLEAGRKRGEVGKPRAWIGEGVILIAPKLDGCLVCAAMVVTEDIEGIVSVTDVDTEDTFEVVIPTGTEHCWILDADFELPRES